MLPNKMLDASESGCGSNRLCVQALGEEGENIHRLNIKEKVVESVLSSVKSDYSKVQDGQVVPVTHLQ